MEKQTNQVKFSFLWGLWKVCTQTCGGYFWEAISDHLHFPSFHSLKIIGW